MKKDMLDDIKRHLDYVNATDQKSIRDIEMQEMYFEIERLNNVIIELSEKNRNLIEDNMRLRKELNLHGGKLYISDIEVKKVWK